MSEPYSTHRVPVGCGPGRGSPFDLGDAGAYRRWRDARLAAAPTRVEDLIVEVRDPRHLTESQRGAIEERCRRANLAIYAGRTGEDPDKSIPFALGAQLGLHRLDRNPGADEDAITAIRVREGSRHAGYIPYTDRPLAWHTDGYYNAPSASIRAFLLHCVRPAAVGGANAVLDHEILYCLIRDRAPEYIRALMHPGCMTIPATGGEAPEGGATTGEGGAVRPDRPGPVFSVGADGCLHMRYTHRARNVVWRDDPLTAAAVDCLKTLLGTIPDWPVDWHFQTRLEPGWGLICNNVLHARGGFSDAPAPRLLYRARYYDRIAGT